MNWRVIWLWSAKPASAAADRGDPRGAPRALRRSRLPLHTHDAWTLFIVDEGTTRYDLDRFLEREARTYHEMGFTQFTLGFNGPAWAVDEARRWLEWRDELNAAASPPVPATDRPSSRDA